MRRTAIFAMVALFAISSAAMAGGRGGHDGRGDRDRGHQHQPKGHSYEQYQQQQQAAYSKSQSESGSGNVIDLSDQSNNQVYGDDFPVAQALAAPLTSSNDTCMGSTSIGGQGMSIGVSIGTTWRDGDCVRRKDARLLHNMGLTGVAASLMCQKDNIATAFEAAGVPCVAPQVAETRAIEDPPVVNTENGESSSYNAVGGTHWDFQ